MKSLAVLAALSLGLGVVSCSETVTNPSDDPSSTTTPAVGSTWTYNRFDADSAGRPIPGTSDSITVMLAGVGLTFEGQAGVMLFMAGNDTMPAIRFEGSGDVGWFPKFARILNTGWLTLPVASHTPFTRTLRDTMIDIGGGQMARNSVVLTITHLGSEELAIADERLASERIRVRVVTTSPLTTEQSLIETESVTLWFSSKAGYFIREETARSSQSPFGTTDFPARVMQLVAYSRK